MPMVKVSDLLKYMWHAHVGVKCSLEPQAAIWVSTTTGHIKSMAAVHLQAEFELQAVALDLLELGGVLAAPRERWAAVVRPECIHHLLCLHKYVRVHELLHDMIR
jgi:hypothetical protein